MVQADQGRSLVKLTGQGASTMSAGLGAASSQHLPGPQQLVSHASQ